MAKPSKFLDRAYELDTAEKTHAFYRDWAASYDEEVRASGYASPARTAAAMAEAAGDLTAPFLDLGCGTGLAGEAFRQAGFTTIDGTDFSEEMLAAAETKGIYRRAVQRRSEQSDPRRAGRLRQHRGGRRLQPRPRAGRDDRGGARPAAPRRMLRAFLERPRPGGKNP